MTRAQQVPSQDETQTPAVVKSFCRYCCNRDKHNMQTPPVTSALHEEKITCLWSLWFPFPLFVTFIFILHSFIHVLHLFLLLHICNSIFYISTSLLYFFSLFISSFLFIFF